MKVIILGCDVLGSHLAAILDSGRHQVTVIDSVESRFSNLPPSFEGAKVLGDGMEKKILRQAGIERVDAFISLRPDDNDNIMVCQIAKEIFNVPKVYCQVQDVSRQQVFDELGLKTFSPVGTLVAHIQKELER